MSRLNDPASVAAQYASPDNFDARVRLYHLYAKTRPTWLGWLFQEIGLRPGERVLEVGTGTGNLWAENLSRLPRAGRIVLSDASEGMLAAARELGAHFSDVRVSRRHDQLDVTNASVLGDYVRSAVPQTPENLERVQALERHVGSQIALAGSFPITVAAGLCQARS
jgi:tRNA A58 N-methylase Trm61